MRRSALAAESLESSVALRYMLMLHASAMNSLLAVSCYRNFGSKFCRSQTPEGSEEENGGSTEVDLSVTIRGDFSDLR
jgi:hypothetical protein